MATSVSVTLGDLTQAFTDALKSVFGGNSNRPPGAPSAQSSGQVGEKVTDAVNKFGQVAEKAPAVITAFLGISNSGGEAAAALKTFASYAPKVGENLSSLIAAIETGRKDINKAAMQGIGGTNFPEFAAQTRAAGFEMAEYGKLLKDQGPSLTALGSTAQEGSQRFLKLTQEAIQSKLGQQVIQFQGNVEGLQNATAIMASNTRVNLERDLEGRAQLAQSSAALAQTIDEQVRVTGKSRDAIEAELKQRMKSPEAILAMNMMSETQRQQFVKTQASLSGMGPSINNLAQTIASGGRMTKDNLTTMAALGPAAADFQRAVRAQQTATDAASKAAADAQMKAAVAKINEFQSSERYARLALQGEGEIAAKQRELIAENQRRAGAATQGREAGVDPAQALRLQEERARLEQQGKIGVGPDKGKIDEGQAATRLANIAQEEARKNTAALVDQFNKLNTTMGKSPEFVNLTTKAIEKLFVGPGGKIGESVESRSQRMTDDLRKLEKEVKGTVPEYLLNPPAEGTRTPSKGNIYEKRNLGSKEATGNWFEDFGLGKIMELHKKEAVVPFDKRFEFVKDILGEQKGKDSSPAFNFSSLQDMFQKNMSKIQMPNLPELPALPKIDMPNFNLAGAIENLKTTVAPPTVESKYEEAPEISMGAGKPIQSAETTPLTPTAQGEDIQTKTLDGIFQLNKTMSQMLSYMAEISESSSKTARLTGKATGNRALA